MTIDRRAFLAAAGATLIATATRAQQRAQPRRIALFTIALPVAELTEAGLPRFAAFHGELKRLGLVDGKNIAVSYFTGISRNDFDELARQVVASAPDIIFALGSPAAAYLLRHTREIPIVFFGADPIAYGIASSLARPGGNLTGFTQDGGNEIITKRLQFLTEMVPAARRIVYYGPTPNIEFDLPLIERAAKVLGVTIVPVTVKDPASELVHRRAFDGFSELGAQAVHVGQGGQNTVFVQAIAALALEHRLPSIFSAPEYAQYGGLMMYAANWATQYKGIAGYVARILKGEKPGDLPIQQPREFDLVINKKTADALGLEIPLGLWVQATEIID